MSEQDELQTPEPRPHERLLSRKTLLKAVAAAGAAPLLLGAGTALARDRRGTGLAPELTPDCDDGDHPTVPQTEGPYFKPNSPLRTSLVTASTPGTRLTVSGYVFGSACLPIANVLLDFWQADTNGAYDNTGFAFRGHQFTNAQGAFSLSTIVPGLYPGRTRHIHVKVQAPNRPVLTTQLYFPGEPRNSTDTIFDARLLMNVRQIGSGKEGTFDFVLNVPQTPNPSPSPTGTTSPSPSPTPGGGSWTPGTNYRAGDRVTYGGASYQCLQAHTAMVGWEPPNVPALWRRL
ncbi:protocatechuate 3,4-dioxygenase beta subunit [Kitasatospora gansuensis]|uniref:Protocatechuate 3,4-dioxygenase beta subunit n=1 Tax=Kitasatospora gansuensis TaxID=258050 RepID=A0A7W7WKC1_9ACTN|nr:carbohydrate-binding protein [Kitasatospora gansuensis]MBB4950667.1 protocatechuate 3,4-dioxygenase beta subunit [Kitasatospora gansuensis]